MSNKIIGATVGTPTRPSVVLKESYINATSLNDLIEKVNNLSIGESRFCRLNHVCVSSLIDVGTIFYDACGFLTRNSATTAMITVVVDGNIFISGGLSLTTKNFTYEIGATSSELNAMYEELISKISGGGGSTVSNLKTYTSLEQLGLVTGQENLESIANAILDANDSCELVYEIRDNALNNVYPGSTGFLKATRYIASGMLQYMGEGDAVLFEFTAFSETANPIIYHNLAYCTALIYSPASGEETRTFLFSGWKKNFDESNPPTPEEIGAATSEEVSRVRSDLTKKANASDVPTKTSQLTNDSNFATKSDLNNVGADSIEILIPSEVVAVVGIEFNVYYKSIIRSNRPLDHFEIKCSLNDTSVPYKLLSECFRLTATESNIGDYTLTIQIKDPISGSVKATKTTTLHIIKNRTLNTKNVLYIGDSLTFSRGGLYSAEIQYNLSGGKLVSIGSQTGSADSNSIGEVKHEGYNGATVGGFLSANVTSGNVNKFYNPSTGQFDLSYFMTNQGYSQIDAVCLNLGHNNIGNHVNAVSGLQTIISKIHEYNADIPIIISLITPLGGQDAWSVKTKSTAEEMRRHWKNLLSAYMTAFDNGKINNVYLSTPYFNVDADNDLPTETVARSARDTTQIVRQNDSMHPNRIATLKMADVYYANLLYRIPEDDAIYYTVTNNLTNVTTSNSVGSVKEGASYSATLTPSDGYVLDSVSVTMNGNPVSVTNGVINISGVTGDIVITATAKVYVPNYTNLAKPSTANDSAPNTALTADEWLNGYYISSKKIGAKADLVVTNKIPLTKDQTLRIKGFADTGNIGGSTCYSRFRMLPCDASGNALCSEVYPVMTQAQQTTGYKDYMDTTELANGVYCFKPSALPKYSEYWTNVAFVRICGYPIDGNNANVIVTVNEPIE